MAQLPGIGRVTEGGKGSTHSFSQIIQFQQSFPIISSFQTLKPPQKFSL